MTMVTKIKTVPAKERLPKPEMTADRGRVLSCVIVEDQSMFLDMLGSMLTLRGGVRVVELVRSVADGRAACKKHRPDLLVLDITLVDGNGLDVAKSFVKIDPEGRVIVVSGNASDFVCPGWLTRALQAVIDKNDTFQSLRRELDDLLGPARPATTSPQRDAAPGSLLTSREAEVFALIGEGLTSREIGERLKISEHTVQTHRKRAAAKLGTQGDELTRIAVAQRTAYVDKPAE
jgi:DNA-binding NarL/FixJ family response regulator